jgi:oligopeptide transport system substrate-binding protein
MQEPAAIVPFAATEPNAIAVVDAVFDSLTAYDDTMHVVPAAAVRWKADASLRIWTFHLRPDATFHDGRPVTARDVVRGWRRAVVEGKVDYHLRDVEGYVALRSEAAETLTGVRAVDDLTVQVRLTAPHAEFPAVVAHPALAPLPPTDDEDAFALRPIGNGPYRMAEPWARGRFIRTARFDGWRNGRQVPAARGGDPLPGNDAALQTPALREVLFLIFDADSAYVAFQQGRADFTTLPPGALAAAFARYGPSPDGYRGPGVLTGAIPVLYYLGFDVTQPPFDDPAVRRAVGLAVDREAIVEANLEGNLDPAVGAVPPALPGAGATRCRSCRHDPAAARALFAEAGVSALTIWISRGGGHERVAEQLRSDFAAAGVRLDVETLEFPEFLAALADGRADFYRFGWSTAYPTLDNALYPLLHSAQEPGGTHSVNYGHYAAEDVDALLEAARATPDRTERVARYAEAEDLAIERDHAIVPLVTYRHHAVASERVGGLVYSPFATIDLAALTLRQALK